MQNFVGIKYDKQNVHKVACQYAIGLQIIMDTIYGRPISWEWYYPYFAAPRISDMRNLSKVKIPGSTPPMFSVLEELPFLLPRPLSRFIPEAFRVSSYKALV
jgi:5'-3' exonuclease